MGAEEREVYHPPRTLYAPSRYRYYGYYSSVYDDVIEPGYDSKREFVKLETNLYDVASKQLVGSMQSETMNRASGNELVESLAGTVTSGLRRDRLLAE